MSYTEQLSKFLRTSSGNISELEKKMEGITGKKEVVKKIIEENNSLVSEVLKELGLDYSVNAQKINESLISRLRYIDNQIFELIGKPDFSDSKSICSSLCNLAKDLTSDRNKGFFIKREKAAEMLKSNPPPRIMSYFKYSGVDELIEKEGLNSIFAALRLLETNEWMHNFFANHYKDLKADDFEERDVELIVLEEKWVKAAEKFLEKKYHNISHLKELGIIFVVPLKLSPGEITRILALLLHYKNEVPFYSGLFKKFSSDADFAFKAQSLLRGDVLEEKLEDPGGGKMNWRLVQRYLAKDDKHDFRLFEPHVNPEAVHWDLAEEDLSRVDLKVGGLDFSFWKKLDFVGGIFKSESGEEEIVSFDFIDLLFSLVRKGKYLYHQQEALWNKIFIEYLGYDEMNRLIEENIIKGYITLEKLRAPAK